MPPAACHRAGPVLAAGTRLLVIAVITVIAIVTKQTPPPGHDDRSICRSAFSTGWRLIKITRFVGGTGFARLAWFTWFTMIA